LHQVGISLYFKNNGTAHGDRCTFMITSHSVLITMRNVLDKYCRKNQNTQFYVQ